MKLLTIDIGTNTILSLHSELEGHRLVSRGDEMEIARLGEGLDKTGRLAPAAIERALAALSRQADRARTVDHVAAIATEAVRKAENAADFLEPAARILGVPVEVVSGHREAELCWIATTRSLPGPAPTQGSRRAVLDIGGGSTEIMVGDILRAAPDAAESVPIGSVRLTERLIAHDPPTDEERRALIATIDEALARTPAPEPGADLVGIAGTVTTICTVWLGLATYSAEVVHGTVMRRSDVEETVERLGGLTLAERKRLPGLDPRRADVVYAGGLILARTMARWSVEAVIVSDRGIRWGRAYELAENATGAQIT